MFAVVEGLARNRDAVDPGLHLGGHAEVVHGHADDDDVGGQELLERDLAQGHVGLHRVVHGGALRCREMGPREMADRRLGKVETSDLEAGMATAVGRDDPCR